MVINKNDSCLQFGVVMKHTVNMPDNMAILVPPRREYETEKEWLNRIVMIKNIGK